MEDSESLCIELFHTVPKWLDSLVKDHSFKQDPDNFRYTAYSTECQHGVIPGKKIKENTKFNNSVPKTQILNNLKNSYQYYLP